MGSIGGQASGDFKLSTSALRILYSVFKDSITSLSPDGFTQNNPNVQTTLSAVSTTIPVNVKKGVLGGSCAMVRPDIGENTTGGAVLVSGAYVVNTRPLGLFINDALGNAYENTPGPASGKGPFLRGGACGNKLYETQKQTTNSFVTGTFSTSGGTVGTALVYSPGQKLYASVNGYLTNDWTDSYEAQWIKAGNLGSGTGGAPIEPDVTRMGTLLAQPDSTSTEMFLELNLA
ncbi:MAG: hypothetical protein ACRD6W_16250 [Nitrososphaerales archaeon]